MEVDYTEIRESFINTSIDMLDRCEGDLIAAEDAAGMPDFTEFLRNIHTIKGNAGIFDLTGLIRICHTVETLMGDLAGKKPGQAMTDELLMAIDVMKSLVKNSAQGATVDADKKTEETILRLEGGKASGHSAQKVDFNKAEKETASTTQHSATSTSFKLPQKYYDHAREKNKNLSFVVVDLAAQKGLTLTKLFHELRELNNAGDLLSYGDISDKLRGRFPGVVAYFIVVLHTGDIQAYLGKRGIETFICENFYTAETAAVPIETNLPVEKTSATATAVVAEVQRMDTHLKVRSELLTSLIDVTGEIVLTRNTLLRRIDQLKESSLQLAGKKLSHLVSDLQDLVMRTRLQPIKTLLARLPRLARDTANQTGKKVNLIIHDGGIEIDKVIYDQIDESLTHLIRNAVDHGIETPAERTAKGKNVTGQIDLAVSMQAGSILISIRDDGKGLDFDAIKNKATAKNLLIDSAAVLDRQAIANLIFLPGFSTRNEVSTISGRGVGMDVVRTCVTRVGGAVDINYQEATGTEFVLRIPQTLSILTCLIVVVGDKRLAIPRQHIAELIMHDETKMRRTAKSQTVLLRDELIPVIDAAKMLGLEVINPSHHLIVRTERHRFALTVSGVRDTEEVVVKPVPVKLKTDQYFSGAAVMGDGEIALILDAHAIIRHNHIEADQVLVAKNASDAAKNRIAEHRTTCLLIEVLTRQILVWMDESPRIEKVSGERIEIHNGAASFIYQNESVRILAWKDITGHEFTQIIENGSKEFYLIIFKENGNKYALIATGLFDIVSRFENPVSEGGSHPAIAGETVVRGRSALIVNPEKILHSQTLSGVNHE